MNPAVAGDEEDRLGLADAGLRRLYGYWRDRCGGRRMPLRQDIDPVEFGWLLGHVSLIDVLSEPPWFRFRLAATGPVSHLGYEVTGRAITAVRGAEMRAYLTTHYQRASETGQPHADRLDRVLDGRHWRSEAVYLPLSIQGATVDMILVGRILLPTRTTHRRVRWPGAPTFPTTAA